ncbi:MAG: protein O-mannosyl-transferase family [Anaerolineae bacterium]
MTLRSLAAVGRRGARLAPAAVFLVTLAAYTRTLLPGLVGGDPGQMQYAARLLVLTHPTGFPLYLALGNLWSYLVPVGSIAYRMNLLSAVAAALACAFVAGSAGRLYGRAIGLACGLTLGFGAVFWGEAVIADKYAFNALMAALVTGFACLYAFTAPGRQRDRFLYLVCLTYGLSLLHHRTMVLFAPSLAALVLYYERGELWRRPGRSLACLALALGLPAAVYALTLPWLEARGNSPIDWRPTTLGGWLAWLQQRDAVALSLANEGIGARLANYWRITVRDYTVWYVALAAAGFVAMARRRTGAALFLALTYVLQAGLAANSQNNPRTFTFFIPSYILLTYAYGQALWLAWQWLAPRLRQVSTAARWAATGLALLAVLWLPAWQFPRAYRVRMLDTSYGEPLGLWRGIVKTADMAERLACGMAHLPANAVLVGDWEQLTVFWYKQHIDGWRPDVLLVYPIERLGEFLGGERPVCLGRGLPVPAGWRVTNVDALACLQPEPSTDVPADMTPVGTALHGEDGRAVLELAGYRVAATVPAGRQVPLVIIWRALDDVGADYSLSLRLLDDAGQQVWQYDAQHPVLGMYPTSQWSAGEVVQDYYEIDVAPGLPPGRYRWAVVLYRQAADGTFQHLRDQAGEHVIVGAALVVGP